MRKHIKSCHRRLLFDHLEDRRMLSVAPPYVEATLIPGQSTGVIEKTVETPEIPPNPDIAFLSDTTGSMYYAISGVQTNAAGILSAIKTAQPTAQFSVSEYRDVGDSEPPGRFEVNQLLTADETAVQTAISGWTAGGGGDTPEAQLSALYDLANGAANWRSDSTRIVVWFGDAWGHDPSAGITEANATTALVDNDVQVVAVDVGYLDATGQATRITDATEGILETGTSTEIADKILAGLSNLPITVTPYPVDCGPLEFLFSPTSQTVMSGEDVYFEEVISVPLDVDPDLVPSVDCTVEFRDDNGNVIGVQSISIDIEPLIVDIDIKPGSFPNSIQRKSMGVIPVAILGSADFDVTTVDVTTLHFGDPDDDSPAYPAHKLSHSDVYSGHLEDVNKDGYLDLVSHYRQKDADFELDDVYGELEGFLLDGTPILGSDSVRIL